MSIDELRAKILARGPDSIKRFGRLFRIMDDDGNRRLDLEELKKGIRDIGLDMADDEVKALFCSMDKDGSGSICFDEMLVSLRAMSPRRQKIVEEAFKKADRSGDGIIDTKDLKRVYKVTDHPKYRSGEWDENQVLEEFLRSFEPDEAKRDGKVTQEEFTNYYAGISASIDNDAYFDLMIRNAWKI